MGVARRVLSPGKGITFTGREIVASIAKQHKTSSSGAKTFRAALLMLNAQCYISNPTSSLRTKVCITEIWENRIRKNAKSIFKI